MSQQKGEIVVSMCRNRKGKLLSAKGDVMAVVDEYASVELDGSIMLLYATPTVNCWSMVPSVKHVNDIGLLFEACTIG